MTTTTIMAMYTARTATTATESRCRNALKDVGRNDLFALAVARKSSRSATAPDRLARFKICYAAFLPGRPSKSWYQSPAS